MVVVAEAVGAVEGDTAVVFGQLPAGLITQHVYQLKAGKTNQRWASAAEPQLCDRCRNRLGVVAAAVAVAEGVVVEVIEVVGWLPATIDHPASTH